MSEGSWWKRFVDAPRATYQRVRMLTPSSIWEGAGLGILAIGAGGATMLFHGLTVWIEHETIDRLIRAGPVWFAVGSLVSVIAGSFLASWLIARFAPSAGGGGVLPVKLAFWREFGVMQKREAVVKLIGSALTLGSGVSMGPEGPSIQIGAATMSAAAGAAGVAKQARRAWCAAGAAAGLAAVFNAPLAAITFVLEEIIGDLNSRLLGRVVVAGVVGALVADAVLGNQPAFQAPLVATGWRSWILVPFVALLAALGGAWFQRSAMILRQRLLRRPRHRWSAYRPVLGAVITWIVGVTVFVATGRAGVFGVGYGDVTAAIAGRIGIAAALMLFGGKILATAGAVGTSGCGGVFAPSLFIGAMAGAAVGHLGALVLHLAPGELALLVMVGMAASLGAVVRVPLTCVLLIFEVTHQWEIVPALLLATLVSQAVSRMVNEHDMYEEILTQNGVDPHQVLPPRHFKRWREIPVTALATFRPAVVGSLDPAALREQLAAARHQRFPVVDAQGRVRGVLPRPEAERVAAEGGEPRLEPAEWIPPKATVGAARQRMLAGLSDFLCVGDAETGELQGVLTLHDLLRGESVLEDDAQS